MAITTAKLHSTKFQLRFCAGSNPARGVSEVREGEDLNKAKRLSLVNHSTKTILHHGSNLEEFFYTMTTEKEEPEVDS